MFTLRNEGLVAKSASHPFTLLALSSVEVSFEGALICKSVPASELRVLCALRVKNHSQPHPSPSRSFASSAPARATTPKSPLPPSLSLCKIRPLPTHSESTVPQPLIPLDFNSFSRNVYKKPGEGSPCPSPKVLQLVTTPSLLLRHTQEVPQGLCSHAFTS
jgi:hypothetical protein